MKTVFPLILWLFLSFTSPVSADLVAWWPFDGDLKNGMGEDLVGEAIGEPAFEQGSFLRLGPGDGEGVSIAADDRLNPAVFTLGYRINLDGVVQGNAGLERLTSREGDSFETAVGDANAVGGTASESGTTLSYFQGSWNVTDVLIPPEGWVSVIWRNTEAAMEIYLDGSLAYEGPPVPAGRSFGYMNIGTRHNETEGFEGLMDDVFLWDEAGTPLSEADLMVIGTDGLNAFFGVNQDLDEDGLPNFWEEASDLDPNDGTGENGPDGDPDGDGLANLLEFQIGTHPRNADSDGDTIPDGEEVALKTNPRNRDTDRDGLDDAAEIAAGTDPTKADTDGDGFLDGFEIASNSDPTDGQSVPGVDQTLILHLSFDGHLDDASGGENAGTALGEPGFDDSISPSLGGGQSIRFNEGDLDGVSIMPSDSLNSDTFTLSYFINQDGAEQGNAGLERLTSRGGDRFETAIGDANAIGGGEPGTLSYYSPATGWTMTGIVVPATGWAHVTWRNKGTGPEDLELFLDGEPVYAGPGVTVGNADLMNVGIRHNGVEGFEGLMDELRLYSIPLSDTDILALPKAGSAGLQIASIDRTADNQLELTWNSSPGQYFDIQKSPDLIPGKWVTVASQVKAADGEFTLWSVAIEADERETYFRVARVAPPALFADDFETDVAGWSAGIIDQFAETATSWEAGIPTNGPATAFGGEKVFGTGLDANYENATGIFLRTPVIDFTGRGRTRLSFWFVLDVSLQEGGRVNLLDGDGNLLQSLKIYDGSRNRADWTEETITLPEVTGGGMIEFEFLSDGNADDNGAGWFIDEVRVD